MSPTPFECRDAAAGASAPDPPETEGVKDPVRRRVRRRAPPVCKLCGPGVWASGAAGMPARTSYNTGRNPPPDGSGDPRRIRVPLAGPNVVRETAHRNSLGRVPGPRLGAVIPTGGRYRPASTTARRVHAENYEEAPRPRDVETDGRSWRRVSSRGPWMTGPGPEPLSDTVTSIRRRPGMAPGGSTTQVDASRRSPRLRLGVGRGASALGQLPRGPRLAGQATSPLTLRGWEPTEHSPTARCP
jgi:hypothetical protein